MSNPSPSQLRYFNFIIKSFSFLVVAAAFVTVVSQAPAFSVQEPIDRTVLPPTAFKGKIGETYKNSRPAWSPALPLSAPAGAPYCSDHPP